MSVSSVRPPGRNFSKRPWWSLALALIFLLAPVVAIGYRLALFRAQVGSSDWVQGLTRLAPKFWLLCLVVWLAGLGLLWVRRWSWAYALAVLLLVLSCDLYDLMTHVHDARESLMLGRESLMLGHESLMLKAALTLVLLLIFVSSYVRLPYVNPRVRWWETDPRYATDIRVTVEGVLDPAFLIDVSMSGALIEWTHGTCPPLAQKILLTLENGPILWGAVVRKTVRGYGIKFVDLSPQNKKYLKNWLHQLATKTYPLR